MKPLSLGLALCVMLVAGLARAGDLMPRDGWQVMPTSKIHAALADDPRAAVKAHGMGIVTQAGPTKAAASRGITIPDNLVVGVFNNDFAVRILALSTAAMIEAPVRFYVTENDDGTATLSYKTPSFVFAPYLAQGGDGLAGLADQLDDRFWAIAQAATQ